jgi:hypothetical protein
MNVEYELFTIGVNPKAKRRNLAIRRFSGTPGTVPAGAGPTPISRDGARRSNFYSDRKSGR